LARKCFLSKRRIQSLEYPDGRGGKRARVGQGQSETFEGCSGVELNPPRKAQAREVNRPGRRFREGQSFELKQA